MPRLIALVRHWQRVSGVGYAATALVGFSQGATMALEAVRSEPDLAGRVIAFSGRFATLPQHKLGNTVVHLLHGSEDPRVSLAHAQEAEPGCAAPAPMSRWILSRWDMRSTRP